jgi:[CysO sulfur-carrier protein]-S-L-cysteine hydrolase
MRIKLTTPVAQRLSRELLKAGRREIGGLLMGEHVEPDVFKIVDISVQRSGGSHACFIRQPHEHRKDLDRFFRRTGADYKRFNYLGEWHSHPSFHATPSDTDLHTMQAIVEDPAVGVNFLVLLIARISGREQMQLSVTAFLPLEAPHEVKLEFEETSEAAPAAHRGFVAWVCDLFSR